MGSSMKNDSIDTPREYEFIVQELLRARVLYPHDDTTVNVFHRKQHVGKKSGHSHEIDITFELSLAGIQILILVECKCYRRAVGVEDVLEFTSRIQDIGAHKGIMVTTTGFQQGAVKIAEANGIGLAIASVGYWVLLRGYMGFPTPRYSQEIFVPSHLALVQNQSTVEVGMVSLDKAGLNPRASLASLHEHVSNERNTAGRPILLVKFVTAQQINVVGQFFGEDVPAIVT